jgi:hypothetical protein
MGQPVFDAIEGSLYRHKYAVALHFIDHADQSSSLRTLVLQRSDALCKYICKATASVADVNN